MVIEHEILATHFLLISFLMHNFIYQPSKPRKSSLNWITTLKACIQLISIRFPSYFPLFNNLANNSNKFDFPRRKLIYSTATKKVTILTVGLSKCEQKNFKMAQA